jgi:hypothetical protein
MRSLLLTAFIGACVACGTNDSQVPAPTADLIERPAIDSEVKGYVDMFMADCEARRTDCKENLAKILEIRVVTIPDLNPKDDEVTVGLCYDGFFFKRIHINKIALAYHGRYMQTLIYHELGHCMYNLDHEEKLDMIMSPVMPSIVTLVQNWNLLLADLFVAIEEKHGP